MINPFDNMDELLACRIPQLANNIQAGLYKHKTTLSYKCMKYESTIYTQTIITYSGN